MLYSSLVLLIVHTAMLDHENVLSRAPHLHFQGSGAWFRQLDAMIDSAAFQVLVAGSRAGLLATATTRDNAGGSSASVQSHKRCVRLEKLVPEDWKEWQYQFGDATHACSSSMVRCWRSWTSPTFDESDHEDIVENTANLTNVDVSR